MARKRGINDLGPTPNAIVNIVLLLYSMACFVPLLCVMIIAVTSEKSLVQNGYRLIPGEFSTLSFQYLSANGKTIFNAYLVTIFTTVVGTTLSLMISSMYAFPISRRGFRYGNKFAFFVYFTMLFNGGTVPLYIVYTQVIPLRNTIWALIVPNMVSGFNVLLMRTYFSSNIPDEIVEAANIDGAGFLRIYSVIVMPLSKPVLASLGLLTAIAYWNDYFRNMLFIFNDSVVNLQYLLWRIQMQLNVISTTPELLSRLGEGVQIPQESVRMGMVVVTIGPIVLLYPFLQKFFIKGLTIGSIKG